MPSVWVEKGRGIVLQYPVCSLLNCAISLGREGPGICFIPTGLLTVLLCVVSPAEKSGASLWNITELALQIERRHVWAGLTGILHLDQLRVFNSRIKQVAKSESQDEAPSVQSPFGVGLLVGSLAVRYAYDFGCTKAELLAINDNNQYGLALNPETLKPAKNIYIYPAQSDRFSN